MDATIIIYVVIAIAVIGLVATLLLRGRRTPPGTYTTTRDANDPAAPPAGGGTDTLEAPRGPTATAPPPSECRPKKNPCRPASRFRRTPQRWRPHRWRRRRRSRAAWPGWARAWSSPTTPWARVCAALFSRDNIDDDVWDEIEETLLLADIGTEPTLELVEALRERVRVVGSRNPPKSRRCSARSSSSWWTRPWTVRWP